MTDRITQKAVVHIWMTDGAHGIWTTQFETHESHNRQERINDLLVNIGNWIEVDTGLYFQTSNISRLIIEFND